MNKVFIQTNDKQRLGAIIAKYSIEKNLRNKNSLEIELINVDGLSEFGNFWGKEYLMKGYKRKADKNDLQSFTLTRFLPPELMNFQGKAVVIDPDIFAATDITELFNLDIQGKTIAACRKKDAWDSSVMLLDCKRLKHWGIKDILKKLENFELDYSDIINLKTENQDNILEIPRVWNNLDNLHENTKLIHMTNRLTQPWKTGLKIDFTRNPMPKFWGIIPREWIHKILGKYPSKYQRHPDKNIEKFFFTLLKSGINDGAVTKEFIQDQINKKHIRVDTFNLLNSI